MDLIVRERVCSSLNAAVLGRGFNLTQTEIEKSSPRSSLETLYRQILCVDNQMSLEGVGSRNLVDLSSFINN